MKHGANQVDIIPGLPQPRVPMADYRAVAERNRRSLPKGSAAFCGGDPTRGVFLVLDGVMEVHMPSSNGEMQLSHLLWPGHWIGAEATLAAGPHFAGAYARTDLEVGVIPFTKVLELAAEDGTLWRELGMIATRSQRVTSRALLDALLRDPDERIAATLLRLTESFPDRVRCDADCIVPISQGELAMIANLCRNTTHKVLGRMADRNLIALSYRGIRICSLDRLERFRQSFQN